MSTVFRAFYLCDHVDTFTAATVAEANARIAKTRRSRCPYCVASDLNINSRADGLPALSGSPAQIIKATSIRCYYIGKAIAGGPAIDSHLLSTNRAQAWLEYDAQQKRLSGR